MSEPRPLTMSGSNMMECKDEDFIFLHTNYPEKTTVMIVELVITRDINMQKSQCSGGFAVCPIFQMTEQSKTALVQSGTPRSIGALESDKAITQQNRTGKTTLIWDVRDYQTLQPLQELTPMNCFVGKQEMVPGL